MSKINNPFVMYGYKGEAYFCDRKQESNAIENILYNGNHVSVISPRRMGKTGLVHPVRRDCLSDGDGTTWYVQAQMNMLYQHEAGVVTETTMQECLQEVIRLQESGFNKIYSLLTNTQAKVLSAIASEGCVSAPRSSAFLQKYELKSGSIDRALTYLMDNEYIYKKEEGYIVYDYFFGLWLK